ncbi:MAG: sugar phosphate isomerase/epimerase [Spirochaetaceae bacterium]|nr:MAG: sugar phosphate isomerase/epimerase [Spirochaetaceae bacterium]
MIKGINYWAFPPGSDGKPVDVMEAMRIARDLGYDSFEPTVEAEGRLSPATDQRQAEEVRNTAEKLGLKLPTVACGLAWGCSPTDPDPRTREQACRTTESVLQIAFWLGAETILYLPGMVSAVFVPQFTPQPYDEVHQRAVEALKRVLATAEQLGVKLAVENVWNRFLLSPVEMRDFIDSFDSPYVGSYFDVGNVMLYGHPEHWIRILGHRIFAVHLKDFKVAVGNLDGFVDLLAGDVDFAAVFREFDAIGYQGPYTAEWVPPTVGAAEKAVVAMRVMESMREGR